jgi:hypothetical protein
MGPLFPDDCSSDRSAPCRYYHLKLQALNGGFHKLSDEERTFVGEGACGTTGRTAGTSRTRSRAWLRPTRTTPTSTSCGAVGSTGERFRFLGG